MVVNCVRLTIPLYRQYFVRFPFPLTISFRRLGIDLIVLSIMSVGMAFMVLSSLFGSEIVRRFHGTIVYPELCVHMYIMTCVYYTDHTGWFKKLLTQLWTFIFGNEYIKRNIKRREALISFHENVISSKSVE